MARLTSENTEVLLIDFQEKIVPAMHNASELIPCAKRLVQGCGILSLPMVVTRQYPKGLGDTVEELREHVANATVYDKKTFSCLGTDEIRAHFSNSSRANVLIAGIETHICVLQTALDLLSLGKNVSLAVDGTGSRTRLDMTTALERLWRMGVTPTTVESFLFETLETSSSPGFKEISKLVTGRL
ncbi:MAG: isochorismatase family protein [Planctomycetia bacterium]|nr:isochorismatase family protein [Planctomycetia bacterium]